ncbi:conidial pigment biosynthesis oxidase Arb2/brown2 [Aspergillus karnatakaensis]|uniref:conidial pigment biosynthesis oxidase Arb2/brown2 n=1 Tax=Aspergillus karnatakaensis TaxID=1810916 RepID=UPI003CCD4D5F
MAVELLFFALVWLVSLEFAVSGQLQKRNLIITNELGAPDGQQRYVLKVNGQFPGPTLIFDEGDDVENGTPYSDGVPGLTQAPIEHGESFIYRFKAYPAGTHWYHSHVRAQLMDGLYGAIVIRRKEIDPTLWHLISKSSQDIAEIKSTVNDPKLMLLSDWSRYNSTEYIHYEQYAQLAIVCFDSYLINGKGWVNCPGHDAIVANTLPGIHDIFSPDEMTEKGCFGIDNGTQSRPGMLPRDLYFDCVPANGSKEIIEVDSTKTQWISLNFVATVTASALMVSIDEHPMWVYEVDGNLIEPTLSHAFDIRAGERYAVLVNLDKAPKDYTIRVPSNGQSQVIWTWATLRYTNRHSDLNSTESIPYIKWDSENVTASVVFLDRFSIKAFPPIAPANTSDVLHKFSIHTLNGSWQFSMTDSLVMFPLDWRAYEPMLQTGVDTPDSYNTSLVVRNNYNQWVDLLIQWNEISDSTSHVIHKHGTKFWVLGTGMGVFTWNTTADAIAAQPEAFNLVDPPYRDTVSAPPYISERAWLLLRYQASNPGVWLLHCHFETHLATGFAQAILDGVDNWPEIPLEYTMGHNGER